MFCHNVGMLLIDEYGYTFTWSLMAIFAMLGVVVLFILLLMLKKEKSASNEVLQRLVNKKTVTS
jgi:type VI protein secretion system component VasF